MRSSLVIGSISAVIIVGMGFLACNKTVEASGNAVEPVRHLKSMTHTGVLIPVDTSQAIIMMLDTEYSDTTRIHFVLEWGSTKRPSVIDTMLLTNIQYKDSTLEITDIGSSTTFFFTTETAPSAPGKTVEKLVGISRTETPEGILIDDIINSAKTRAWDRIQEFRRRSKWNPPA